MCDLGISAIVASVVATAMSTTMGVVSSVQSGKAQKAQYEYQAAVDRKNAQIAQSNADMKRQEGIEEARTQRIKTLQAVGSQQAAMAANGFDATSGTNLDIIEDTSAQGELDALTKQYNKETEALSYETSANNYSNQANLDSMAGQNAYKTGMLNAVGTGFKGLGQVATSVSDKWYSPNSLGTSTEYTTKTRNFGKGYVGTLPTF
jgi:hypothetical protein|nr:MAG TPA: hypothetical protein [Caudoviricetes sp.]